MKTSRRSFIKNSSIILAGSALLSNDLTNQQPGIKNEKIAIQLFSVDKEMNADARGTLTALKKTGYEFIEHADYASRKFYGFTPVDFKKLVNDCGLTLLSGHTVLKLQHWDKFNKDFTPEWYYTIEDAAKAGQQYIISPWLEKSVCKDEKGVRGFMEIFNRSGELCKKAGLKFGYHNHHFEFTTFFDSVRLYDIILQDTDPNLVLQQLDAGNIFQDHFSVTDLFKQYPGRFDLMHIKDIIPASDRHHPYKTVALGNGVLDIPNLVTNARKFGGTCNFVIEQNEYDGRDALECAKENHQAFINIKNIATSKNNEVFPIPS